MNSLKEPHSGLEVVPAEHDIQPHMQSVNPGVEPYSQLEAVTVHKEQKPLAHPTTIEQTAHHDEPTNHPVIRKRKRKWIVGGIIVGLVIICAVIGGVLGSLLTKKDHAVSTPQATNGSTASQTNSGGSSSTVVPVMSGTATTMTSYTYPTAVSWGEAHLEVWGINSDGNPGWKYKNTTSSWSPQNSNWESIGGIAASLEPQSIAAVTRSKENVDIFVTGTDYALYHKYHSTDLSWGPSDVLWEDQGGVISTPPTVVSWGSDRLDIFALGAGPRYQLFQKAWSDEGGWEDWYGLSDGTWELFAPSVVTWAPERLDVFLVDKKTKTLHHTYYDGSSWLPSGGYDDLEGYCMSRPVVLSRQESEIDVFVRGGDAGLWRLSYSNSWGNWTAIGSGTAIQGEPEAVSWGKGNIELFAWGIDSSLLYKRLQTLNGVETWTPTNGFAVLGTGLTGPPKAIADGQGSVQVFAYLTNGQVGHVAWDQDSGEWSPQTGFDLLGSVSNLGGT